MCTLYKCTNVELAYANKLGKDFVVNGVVCVLTNLLGILLIYQRD